MVSRLSAVAGAWLVLSLCGCDAFAGPDEEPSPTSENPSELTFELEGAWEAMGGLEFLVRGDGATVTAFGSSKLGTNAAVFQLGGVYLKNIVRVGRAKWTALIVEAETAWDDSSPNASDWGYHLKSIRYVPTEISVTAMSQNAKRFLAFSRAGEGSYSQDPSSVSGDGGVTPPT